MNMRFAAWLLSGALLVSGCAAAPAARREPPLPVGAPEGLAEVTSVQWAELHPVVNRYFFYRKQAVVAGNVKVLWQQYPALREGMNRDAAVNAEADVVERYRSLQVIDGNVAPEHYARFRVKVDGDKAVVLVNGMELYLRREFEESGGQLQIMLHLERQGGGWTVVKTDETTEAEYHQALR